MDKEQLKVKVETLRANEVVALEALDTAKTTRMRAEQELADAGKPVISESLVVDLVQELESVFAETISSIDTCDLSPEFSLNYNEVQLDCIDLEGVGVDTDELHTVFDQFFAIKDDEELKQDDNS
jgi:hypothetical protein